MEWNARDNTLPFCKILQEDRVTCLNEQLEMFEKQIGDLSSYVDVLKETVNTKDQHTASLYAESEEIRSRLKVTLLVL